MTPAPAPDADALLQAAPVALLHVGADGRLLRCNAAAQALCGPGATPGRPWSELFAAGAEQALSGAAAAAARRLVLRHDPGSAVELGVQPLAGGGWMLALHPTRDPPAGRPSETESLLSLAIELGHIAVWRHDLATDRVHYNASAFETMGMPPRPEGLSLAEVRELVHPDDLARVQASAQRALAQDGPTDVEARYRRVGGGWRHLLARRVLQRDAAGRPQAFIGVALDVTERHTQQRHAEDMTRRFELATAAAGIGYWALAHGEERATWSPALRALFDLPPAAPVPTLPEWLGRHVHPDDRDAVGRQFTAWAQSGRDSLAMPLRIVRPDGSLRYLSTHSLIERGGPQRLMFGVVIDLTERRSAELALRNARERVALAARGAGLGTWELDLQSGEAFWDEQMWLLRGHAPQARAMDEAERRACLHPDDRDAVLAQLADALARGIPFENEFRVIWPDGQQRWLASRSAEVRDEHSGARRRIGVNWDVTDKRSAEAARREREMAQRESLAKSRFLARMSHELRTPLNAVIGFAQLLLAEPGGGAREPARRRQVEHIHAAGEHLLALIDDVLDLSSLESGELRISLQPVALAPLLAQTLPMLEALRVRHGVELQLGALPGVVMADATRLRQVLLNVLSNAIKYNRGGGQVHIESAQGGGELLIRIADTGRGMSAEQLRHLYEPFNRLGRQSEGADGVEGSGIGLAIVKALMGRMGGSVHVQSTPGAGSVFELRLVDATPPAATAPLAPLPAPLLRAGTPRGAPVAPRGTLLYVEDNPVNALIISELIARRADLRLHIATDGRSGVQRALELRPDLVLLDMQLPDFDGHEVLRRLRAHAELAEVPVIALSANAMPDDIERALRAGMADYWTKPLDFTAFMAALDRMFGTTPG